MGMCSIGMRAGTTSKAPLITSFTRTDFWSVQSDLMQFRRHGSIKWKCSAVLILTSSPTIFRSWWNLSWRVMKVMRSRVLPQMRRLKHNNKVTTISDIQYDKWHYLCVGKNHISGLAETIFFAKVLPLRCNCEEFCHGQQKHLCYTTRTQHRLLQYL